MTLVMGGTPALRAPAPRTAVASSALAVSQRTAVTHAPHRPLTTSFKKPAVAASPQRRLPHLKPLRGEVLLRLS